MLKKLFGAPENRREGDSLYLVAVEQARQPFFYTELRVPDTVDGRFDMISAHVFLILRRLKAGGDMAQGTSQALFDAMFEDMDRGLREMGAGDLGVGRRVKAMVQAFYGRMAAYESALDKQDGSLADAVIRNIFRGDENERDAAGVIASYIDAQSVALDHQPIEGLVKGNVKFVQISPHSEDAEVS